MRKSNIAESETDSMNFIIHAKSLSVEKLKTYNKTGFIYLYKDKYTKSICASKIVNARYKKNNKTNVNKWVTNIFAP